MREEMNRHLGWAWLPGPLAMSFSTILVVVHATGMPMSWPGSALFVSGVTTAYMLDRWADPPSGPRPTWCIMLALPAAVVGLTAALWLPTAKITVAVALGITGISYRALKKFPLLKNGLVAAAWAAAGVCFSVNGYPPMPIGIPLGVAIFAVFASGAMLCDMKDASSDARAGVRTAVVLWGRHSAALVAGALALAGTGIALSLGRMGLADAGLVLMVLAAFPKITARPVLGPMLIDGALALPAVLILAKLV